MSGQRYFLKSVLLFGGLLATLTIFSALMAAVDFRIMGFPAFVEVPPLRSVYFTARTSVAIVVSALLMAIAGYANNWHFLGRPPGRTEWLSAVLSLICVLGAFASVALMCFDPDRFYALSLEDSVFEWSSFALLFCASILFLATAWITRGIAPRLVWLVPLLASIILFVVAMEEISWLQRVIGYDTPPEVAEFNIQGEFNLHNLATDYVENAYYAGAFTLFILVPAAFGRCLNRRNTGYFAALVPSSFVALAGGLTLTFSSGMWNIFWIQLAFFSGLFFLACCGFEGLGFSRRLVGAIFCFGTVSLAAIHIGVVLTAPAMVRPWDDTEFKELQIAAACAIYALEVFRRISGVRTQRVALGTTMTMTGRAGDLPGHRATALRLARPSEAS